MKKRLILWLVVLSVLVIGTGGVILLTACSDQDTPKKAKPKPEPIANVFTGQTVDEGFDKDAANRRVVAFVVENAPDARPQWGMDDPEYSPDMILEAEVEGGITRTLWFYDDYKKLPEQIGPMRSARPPFIRFSEFWDAVFIHWGQSHSSGDYVGANDVFKRDLVEHINQMSFSNECNMFDRDHTRSVSSEHTGIVYGDKVEAALKEADAEEKSAIMSKFLFNETAKPMSDQRADEVEVTYSTRSDWETTKWVYDEEDQQYHTDSFKNDLKRDNLLVLYADTEYITKSNYQGPGGASSVTYCDYSLGGGEGKLFSQGTVKDILWKKEDGKFVIIDVEATEAAKAKAAEEGGADATSTDADGSEDADSADAEEAKPIEVEAKLNKGKLWIGWISQNNGGKIDITANEPEEGSTDSESSSGSDSNSDSGSDE